MRFGTIGNRPRATFLLWLLILVSTFAPFASADTKERFGVVSGRVVNAVTSEPLIGASVQIEGTTRGAATNVEGNFTVSDILVGEYRLRVSAIGFETRMVTDIVINPARPVEVVIALTPTLVEMEAQIVRPDYFPRPVEAQVSTQTQSFEEIRRLPGGFEDVVRAVSILPGVAQAEAGRNDLIVRGGAPSENLFVVDNLEIPNINHFGTQGASGGPLSIVNLDFVSGTTFSTGGFGARYGDKLSSVLTLDLRRGRDDRLGGKATIAASQFGVNLEGPVGDAGSFLFSARRSYLDFIFKASGFSFVPEYWDFLAKADYRLNRSNTISVLGLGAINSIRQFNDDNDDRFDNSRVLANEQNQVIASATWQHLFPRGFTELTAGQTLVEFDFRQNDSLLNPVFLNSSREQELSLRGDLTWQPMTNSKLTAGIQGKRIEFKSDIMIPRFTNSFGAEIGIDTVFDTTGYKSSAYAQWSQTLGRITATVGARVDYFNLIRHDLEFAPRASLAYRIGERTTLTVASGRYYQAPSYIWLVADRRNRDLNFVGANQYIAGIERVVRDDTRLRVEGYLKNYFDYPASVNQRFLVLANTGAGFGGRVEGYSSFGLEPLVSQASGRARGIEISMQKKLSEIPCYGTMALSYNQSEFTALDGVTRPGSYDQSWVFNLGGGYVFNEKWEISTKFRFSSGAPYTPYESDGSQLAERYNSERLKSNHSLDVRVDRRWNFSGWTMITYLDIQNIYNNAFNEAAEWNEREQRADTDDSIGLLPSIGISVEF